MLVSLKRFTSVGSSTVRAWRAWPLDAVGEGARVGTVVVGDLPLFALAYSERLVAPRIGRATKADLVPRPRMGVEGGTGVAGPQAPHMLCGRVRARLSASCTVWISAACCLGSAGGSARRDRIGRRRREPASVSARPGRPRACPRSATRRSRSRARRRSTRAARAPSGRRLVRGVDRTGRRRLPARPG